MQSFFFLKNLSQSNFSRFHKNKNHLPIFAFYNYRKKIVFYAFQLKYFLWKLNNSVLVNNFVKNTSNCCIMIATYTNVVDTWRLAK